MKLRDLQKHWNALGKIDPMYSILTRREGENGKWKKEEFFKSGKREIKRVRTYLDQMGISLQGSLALDFGCGIGRLSLALAPYFTEVYGVDISPSMIDKARKECEFVDKCSFFLNGENNLNIFENDCFDFVYSNLTLQHMNPEYAKNYIKEFIRVLKSGGFILFQIPSNPKNRIQRKSIIRKSLELLGVSESFFHFVNLSIDELKW